VRSLFIAYLVWFRYGFFIVFLYAVLVALGNLRKGYRPGSHPASKRFAVLVPAHNEERVIADLLRDLRAMEYPSHLYRVYVIADNCDDATAAIARSEGVTVLERRTAGMSSKGEALSWALERIDADYDAYVVFDADNRVAPTFLKRANDALCEGARLVQCYLAIKNPNDNWVTRALYLHQEVTNHLWHAGKHALGLGNYLVGTGMVISADLLTKHAWEAESLTEDLEYTLRMALEGHSVVWLSDVAVYDEKPSDLKSTYVQQQRWMIGTWKCFQKYFLPVLRKGVAERRADIVDLALYLFAPVWIVMNVVYGAANLINSAFNIVVFPPDPAVTVAGTVFGLAYFAAGLRMAGIPVLKNLALVMVLLALYPTAATVQVVWGLFRINERRWYHTPHGAKLDPEIRLGSE
jgi:cellulose synthase/poly-beta-1,6-N-acetylglucosamine synthase-like glycosyltransferase